MKVKSLEGPLEDRYELEEQEIAAVKRALKTKLWDKDESKEARLPKFQKLVDELSEALGLEPAPKLVLNAEMVNQDAVGAQEVVEEDKIYLGRLSLVSVINAVGRMWRIKTEGDVNGHFSVGFGLAAFKQAAPRLFAAAKEDGKLYYYRQAEPDPEGCDDECGDCNCDDDDGIPRDGENRRTQDGVDRGNGPGED
jgi:hypothetical protein